MPYIKPNYGWDSQGKASPVCVSVQEATALTLSRPTPEQLNELARRQDLFDEALGVAMGVFGAGYYPPEFGRVVKVTPNVLNQFCTGSRGICWSVKSHEQPSASILFPRRPSNVDPSHLLVSTANASPHQLLLGVQTLFPVGVSCDFENQILTRAAWCV